MQYCTHVDLIVDDEVHETLLGLLETSVGGCASGKVVCIKQRSSAHCGAVTPSRRTT